MNAADTIRSAGMVEPRFLDVRTGELVPWPARHNTISFDATRAMALAFGGDSSLIPNRIGIIYGGDATTQFPTTITRDQEWADLAYELQGKNADVQVQPFCYSPSFVKVYRGGSGPSGSSDSPEPVLGSSDLSAYKYPGWAVTFHAHSDSVTGGVLRHDDPESGNVMIFATGSHIFQALLLNETAGKYTILARVSLDSNGTYYSKPENFEVAIDWTVKFF